MKVCIFGAGAVGGHIAVRLLESRAADIAVVARGATLRAIRSRGLTLRSGEKEISVKVPVATDDPFTLAPQDLVVVTLKAPALPEAAAAIAGGKARSCECGCGKPVYGRKKLASAACRKRMERRRSLTPESGSEKHKKDGAFSVTF